jgi:hypothetical protein
VREEEIIIVISANKEKSSLIKTLGVIDVHRIYKEKNKS